jgi:hypothetical protein
VALAFRAPAVVAALPVPAFEAAFVRDPVLLASVDRAPPRVLLALVLVPELFARVPELFALVPDTFVRAGAAECDIRGAL